MSTYHQLQEKIRELRQLADEKRTEEIDRSITRCRAWISTYGLAPEDVFDPRALARDAKAAKAVLPPKFISEDGRTWSGRGGRPEWLRDALAAGHPLSEFRIGFVPPKKRGRAA